MLSLSTCLKSWTHQAPHTKNWEPYIIISPLRDPKLTLAFPCQNTTQHSAAKKEKHIAKLLAEPTMPEADHPSNSSPGHTPRFFQRPFQLIPLPLSAIPQMPGKDFQEIIHTLPSKHDIEYLATPHRVHLRQVEVHHEVTDLDSRVSSL